MTGIGDSGTASRFFPRFRYEAKANGSERNAGLRDGGVGALRDGGVGALRDGGVGALRDGGVGALRDGGRANTSPRANFHPTVKPIDLMRWLCRLVTPPGALILDPFAGSGSTIVAALREGFRGLGIEREAEYVEIARRRVEEDAPLFQRGGAA